MKLSSAAQAYLDAPQAQREAFDRQLREHVEAETDFKRWLAAMDDPTDGRPEEPVGRLKSKPRFRPRKSKPGNGDTELEKLRDLLDAMDPREYWEALTGDLVEGRVRCPNPEHPDEHPACRVYNEPGRGWWCPVCNEGGTAIDLAAHLSGIQPKGRGYFDLLRWIGERL